jgi:hypothetical protein
MIQPAFAVEDILLSTCAGGQATWVSCPYAMGVPEILKGFGGKWDKFANAWAIPNGELDGLRKRLPKVAEMVRIQQAIDFADGKPARPVSRPNIRTAGPALPESVIGEDWISMGVLDDGEESSAARALGCARKNIHFQRHWFAPSQDVADQLTAALKSIRDDAELRAARKRERDALERQRQQVLREQAAEEHAKAIQARDEALAEIKSAWPTARFIKVTSKLLDRRGETIVDVTTPTGRTVSALGIARTESTQLSRRVQIVEVWAPVFPAGAGFKTRVTTTDNGKEYTRDLRSYEVVVPATVG